MSRHNKINFESSSFRKINKHYGKSFYAGTIFSPKEIREVTYALYTFLRIPDEIVDENNGFGVSEKTEALEIWKEDWKTAFETSHSRDKQLNRIALHFHTYEIPFDESEIFLNSMAKDIDTNRYQTYTDLKDYMYGSAGIVGVMMTRVIGLNRGDRYTKDENAWKHAFQYAIVLGEAFQMTNFLRDIKEDIDERNKIYIPVENLIKFKVSEEDIKNHVVNKEFISLMKFEIERARVLYRKAEEGINLLHPSCHKAIRIVLKIYEKIIDKIEKNNYDVFTKKIKINIFEKMLISYKINKLEFKQYSKK